MDLGLGFQSLDLALDLDLEFLLPHLPLSAVERNLKSGWAAGVWKGADGSGDDRKVVEGFGTSSPRATCGLSFHWWAMDLGASVPSFSPGIYLLNNSVILFGGQNPSLVSGGVQRFYDILSRVPSQLSHLPSLGIQAYLYAQRLTRSKMLALLHFNIFGVL